MAAAALQLCGSLHLRGAEALAKAWECLWSRGARAAARLKQLALLNEFSYEVQEGVFLKSLFQGRGDGGTGGGMRTLPG